MKLKDYTVTIGWLYPDLMSTYGDRGNIFVLKNRLAWRKIEVNICNIDVQTKEKEIALCDIVVGGGAQDKQQAMVVNDLLHAKKPVLSDLFRSGVPGLFVCGSPQLLGQSYTMADGTKLPGLGFFDMETRHPGPDKPRLIGNIVAQLTNRLEEDIGSDRNTIVGFENHGGRTYLGKSVTPLATVLVGNGNNGEDTTEGAYVNNWFATYFHGPFLSKNPHIADYLLAKALEVKYGKKIPLTPLEDGNAWQAHDFMKHRLLSQKK